MIKEAELDQYLVYNKPIPYIANSLIKRRQFLQKEIFELQSIKVLTQEQEEILKQLEQEYNSQIIYIHPVKVDNYNNFFYSVNCLTIEKNKIPDPKIISMSYLDFLFHLITNDENGNIYSALLVELFKLCLNLESKDICYKRDENNKINLILNHVVYDKNDFDNIKKIILHQNIPEYDDTYIDPKVEAALKEAQEFMNRNKKKMASLEDQIVCVMLALHETDETKIHNLTIRKFSKILQRYDYKLHYEIYKQAECSGMASFKEEIHHWMSDLSNKNKYSDVIVDYGQFKKKIESAKTQ